MKLSWKGLPGTNTLAYYENPKITAVKSFIGVGPGGQSSNLYLIEVHFFNASINKTSVAA